MGFVDPVYPDGHQGSPNWTEEELTEMTRKANANGVAMHIHVMGNKGVTRIVKPSSTAERMRCATRWYTCVTSMQPIISAWPTTISMSPQVCFGIIVPIWYKKHLKAAWFL